MCAFAIRVTTHLENLEISACLKMISTAPWKGCQYTVLVRTVIKSSGFQTGITRRQRHCIYVSAAGTVLLVWTLIWADFGRAVTMSDCQMCVEPSICRYSCQQFSCDLFRAPMYGRRFCNSSLSFIDVRRAETGLHLVSAGVIGLHPVTKGIMFPAGVIIGRKFVTSAKKFANFNEFSEIKKIRTKIR